MASSEPREVQWVIKNTTGRSIAYYSIPSSSSKIIGYLPSDSNKSYTVSFSQGNFCYIIQLKGWVRTRNVNVTDLTPKSENAKKAESNNKNTLNGLFGSTSANTSNQATTANNYISVFKDDSPFAKEKKKLEKNKKKKTTYKQYVNKEYGNVTSTTGTANKLLKNNLNGIYGLPYQFPAFVDPKVGGDDGVFGTIYADRIINRMPLLFLSPGKVDFMADYKENEGKAAIDALINSNTLSKGTLDEFISKPGKYYTFSYDELNYWKYVNSMNHACAVYLGIGDIEVNINGHRGKLSKFKWEYAHSSLFDSLLMSNKQYVCFYLDAEPTRSESFNNSTTESQLASKVNSFSDIAKEVQFLVGTQTGNKLKWVEEEGIAQVESKLNSMCDEWLNGSAVFKNITKEFAVIATGGKLIFPEIWADSEFSQSYDVNMKFRCPNPNRLSWYLDIIVPLNHILALTLPRTPIGKNIAGADFEPAANGYMSPFLVRAFSRGMFNVDMGIITNLSISKGKESSWSIDGLPSEVDVSIEIKDLFNLMAMTHPDNTVAFMQNNQYLNYLANSCGVSINKPDLERSIDLWLMVHGNYYKDRLTGYNFWTSAKHGVQNKLLKMYQGIFKG